MKKILICFVFLISFLMVGCGKYGEKDVIKDLTKKISSSKGYYIEGQMQIINNEDVFNYDINVSYQNKEYYRVSLKNKANNHEQIILKNDDGVYVLTPSLNKSFKFQSDWPYNNSQVYLLQSIIRDIKQDNQKKFNQTNNRYTITTKVNYPNNKKLTKEIIYMDKNLNIKEVQVLDNDNNAQIKMKFNSIDLKATFDKKYFALNENVKNSTAQTIKEVTSIEDVVYPMYLPKNTQLTDQEKITKNNGERIILTFEGENPFMLVEETVTPEQELSVIPTYGEPEILIDTIGAISDTSITWASNGIEYYLVSDVLSSNQLIEIAKSMYVLPVSK
jgi:outer membrane lipoprotein-sorting protein